MEIMTSTITGDEIAFTGVFTRVQAAGPRKFNVRGPKAASVRELVVAGGHSRKDIAQLAGCSVSRVAEVVWGLDYDGTEYPAIPARSQAPAADAAAVDAAILADAAE